MGGLVSKVLCLDELFKGRHFDAGVIELCVRWYLGYKLSCRDLAEKMAERGPAGRSRASGRGSKAEGDHDYRRRVAASDSQESVCAQSTARSWQVDS
jgi:transposase-like protein